MFAACFLLNTQHIHIIECESKGGVVLTEIAVPEPSNPCLVKASVLLDLAFLGCCLDGNNGDLSW